VGVTLSQIAPGRRALSGYGQTAMLIACIYILGFAVTPLLPETKGKVLPDRV
jgi:hypothetical protein